MKINRQQENEPLDFSNLGKVLAYCQNLSYLEIDLTNMRESGEKTLEEFFLALSNISKCEKLSTLNLNFNVMRVNRNSLYPLLSPLIDQENITKIKNLVINLRYNDLLISGATSAGVMLSKFKNLQSLILYISGNSIGDRGLSNLCLNLDWSNLTSIKFSLTNDKIGDKGISKLCSVLEKCQNLTNICLFLSQNQIASQGASKISAIIKKSANLEKLDLDLCNNKIGDFGASHINSALASCTNLTKLYFSLGQNKITDKGISYISNGLSKMTKISELSLDLSYLCYNKDQIINKIGQQGVSALGSCLSSFQNLQILSLIIGETTLEVNSFEPIVKSFSKLINISDLHLQVKDGFKTINEKDLINLAQSIEQSQNLQTLALVFNKIITTDEGMQRLANSIKKCSNLANLTISLEKYTDNVAAYLCAELSNCPCLKTLSLSFDYGISDTALSDIGKEIAKCSYLNTLKLCSKYFTANQYTHQGVFVFISHLKKLKKLFLVSLALQQVKQIINIKILFKFQKYSNMYHKDIIQRKLMSKCIRLVKCSQYNF
ncbi:hypothetical protein TTHERM_00024010 (macronuclear) [Tetrahymena thermophila SB210]|uniref:Kinase domain protein n=1 Tax=Tetrahymena thermophila (strain SB210) TaxID=312017 RepID=Q22R80_TETTS|nr:hypothetical protein TTHERM_00024010 [Tetrahymena thermophila SB210]EAR88242.2 hypothetical protein TTHERM_00024010 [Tetrahymena thermophila SB210]|eukprot:XP_001008487.2 hypothetical protein TTHERM_00024010 [Tetrahymena thermophila SB210]